MANPLRVSLENIIPLTEARDHFSQIVNEVQKDKLYVLTKGGKPAVAIIDVKYLEAITGGNVNQNYIKEEIKKAPEKVGLAPMIEHKDFPPPTEPKPTPKLQTPPITTPPAPVSPAGAPKPPTPVSPVTKPQTSASLTPPPTFTTPSASPPVSAKPSPDGSQDGSLPPKSSTPPSPMTSPIGVSTGAPVSMASKPVSSTAPANTNAVIETNTNPFVTKQQTTQATPISVNFSPDYNEKEMKNKPGQAAPEDRPGPAQYSGSSTAAGGDANKEPDDMAID